MRTRTRIKKDASTKAEVFRLTDMVVEEVSAVDRAANKRTFLVVKSAAGTSAPMPGEITTGADGSLTVTKAPAPEGEPTTPAESQAAPTSPEEPPVPTDTNPPEAPNGTPLRMSREVKAELGARIVDAVKALGDLGARVASAEEVDGVAEVPGELIEALSKVASALGDGVAKSDVAKGRKQISMARESKIRAAHAALGEIVSELDAPAPAPAAEVAPEVAPAPAPEVAPAAKVDKRDVVIAGLVQTVERLASQVGGIGTAITKQAQRLDDVARARPMSNAVAIDDRAPTTKRESATVWPLDMNDGPGAVAGVPSGDFASR